MQDLDKEMEAVQAAALAADQGDNAPAQDTPPAAASAPASASPEQTETPAAQGEAQQQQKPEPSKETPPTPPTAPEGQKPESAFTKAQKEKARREKTWAEINAEKEQLAADRKALEEERKRLAEEQHRQPAKPETPQSKYSAEDYDAAAKHFEAKGDYELAEQAKAKAAELRAAQQPRPEQGSAAAAPQNQVSTPFGAMPREQFMTTWQSTLERLVKAEPDLANKDSELGKTTAEMLRTYPLLNHIPTGIQDAVAAAKLTIQARRVPVLEKELAAAKAELGRLNKTNSLRGGPPGMPPAGPKSIEDMSLDEAEAAARAAALAADQG